MLDTAEGPANVLLENHVKITQKMFDAFGEDFETTSNGRQIHEICTPATEHKPLCG